MTLTEQFSTMIAMTMMGIWIGLTLTTYQRLIHPKKKWHWIMIVTDIMFWIFQGLLIFYVLLSVNQGDVRFYIFLALACGFACYKALIESTYQRFLEWLIYVFDRLTQLTKRLLKLFFVQPIVFLLKLLYQLVKMIGRTIIILVLFIFSIVLFPFKLIVRWFIPTAWVNSVINFFARIKAIINKWVEKFR